MIEKIIKKLEAYNRAEREEELLLERLQTRAEGIGSVVYGDDTSHGTATGDRMENAAITLTEAREKINARRINRFNYRSDICDWFYKRLKSQAATVMVLYAVKGLNYRQISDKTGRSVGWVSNTISESKKILSKDL